MKEYLKWLTSRRQWIWWLIFTMQAVAVVATENRLWAGLILAWIFIATLYAFSSDEWRDTSEGWQELCDNERKLSEGYEKLYNETKDMLLAERRRP